MRETGSNSLGVPKLFLLAALLAIKVPRGSDGAGKGLGSPPGAAVGFSAAVSLQAGQGGGCPALAERRWDPRVQDCGCPPHGRGCEPAQLPPALPPPARD